MKVYDRRKFIFSSIKSSLLLSSTLGLREVKGQTPVIKPRFLTFIDTHHYPNINDWFPEQAGPIGTMPPIFSNFNDLKSEMAYVKGVDIRDSGDSPKNNNHVRGMGKCLTASDVTTIANLDALHGGPSIDHIVKQEFGVNDLLVQVEYDSRGHTRDCPFSTGKGQRNFPTFQPMDAWDLVFKDFVPPQPGSDQPSAAQQARMRFLTERRSILDGFVQEIKRLQGEMSGNLEKEKLEAHLAAIQAAEKSTMNAIAIAGQTNASCAVPPRPNNENIEIPYRSKAMLDLQFAAMTCGLVGVSGILFGRSNSKRGWTGEWLGDDVKLERGQNWHDHVYHSVRNDPVKRGWQIRMSRWTWDQMGAFIRKLKAIPEGEGNMFDNTLIYSTSHFGLHHQITNIPVLFMSGALSKLNGGQTLEVNNVTNAKALTTCLQLLGIQRNGFGDEPQSGAFTELIK